MNEIPRHTREDIAGAVEPQPQQGKPGNKNSFKPPVGSIRVRTSEDLLNQTEKNVRSAMEGWPNRPPSTPPLED